MPDLLNVDRALATILATIQPLASELIPLENALGRTLAEAVTSNVNLPPFPNSSMDGFAVQSADTLNASADKGVALRLVADIPAGTASAVVLRQGEAARIMTGAPLPDGADAVIPVESTDAKWTPGSDTALPPSVTIHRSLKGGDYVRKAGEDIRSGETLVKAGTKLRAAELGILAAIGQAAVKVYRQPHVAIISTGDELIEVSTELTPGKIRDSNSYTIAALVTEHGGIPIKIPTARDTLEDVRQRFREALDQQPDLIISSAGVSVGAFDVVRTIIDEMGHVDFWKINLRPGKPLAYGQVGGVPFFGLPGNPVSAMVTFDVFVRPTLLKLAHQKDDAKHIEAATSEDIDSDGRRSYIRVNLKREQNQWVARTTGTQSSGALSSMMLADGLLIIPEDVTFLPAGSISPIRLLRPLEEIG
ncbi:MAG: molybdopterin molybdotransferase MoeA [Chloroflexi bacterium]|nr:molybdopterin molybdotransferase MoeA [Chloroflexota bacterium]MCC6892009.1 molybdopterin molybdotransferase MoeA [Anaerolineae bacterium]